MTNISYMPFPRGLIFSVIHGAPAVSKTKSPAPLVRQKILAAITNPVSTIFCETIDRKGAPARQRDVRCSGHDAAKDINR